MRLKLTIIRLVNDELQV